ncbi:MAG TPA: TrmH family RNA methyltransferase [Vicinamibacterales bacterium]|nr:TrmH family RNA methyltransferase [Vicinamibacterales bacterium]
MIRLPAIVVLDNVRSLYNTGAFFRTADAVGIEKLVLCGITPRPDQAGRQARAIAKTALGSERSVRWEYEPETSRALEQARASGHRIVIAETATGAVDLFAWAPSWPVCVVFGHEVTGVRTSAASGDVTYVRIPMFGAKTSLNVATAGGVVLYELLRKRLYLQDTA